MYSPPETTKTSLNSQYPTPEENWAYLKSQIGQLRIGPTPLSLNSFLCFPQNTSLDWSRLNNLKFLCEFVDEKESNPTQCALIMHGAIYYFYQQNDTWSAWATGGQFGSLLASCCQDMKPDFIKVALGAFETFIQTHPGDIFERADDDNLSYLLAKTPSVGMCIEQIAALKEALDNPGLLEQVWNGTPFS